MVSRVLALGSALGVSVLASVEVVSGFGGGKILGGKGARYTTVVSRPPIAQPLFSNPIIAQPYGGNTILQARDEPFGRNPFQGARAAVSGDVIGVAPMVAHRPREAARVSYDSTGSMLGESLGLVPGNVGDGIGLSTGGFLSNPLMNTLQYPGFPRFEPDGYIVHDQRGRDASTCPPGGCGEAGTMSPEMQSMYDKYKRYYRNFGGSTRAAPAPGSLVEPVPISQYSRMNSGLASGGSHFVASPLLDGRNGGRLNAVTMPGGRMPAAVQHYAHATTPNYVPGATIDALGRIRGGTDRVALGTPSKARDSFFGKIYEEPDHLAEDSDLDHDLIYDGTRSPQGSAYGAQYYGSSSHGQQSRRYADDEPERFEDLPEYTGESGRIAQKAPGSVGSGSPSLAERLSEMQENFNNNTGRIAGGGLVDKIQDLDAGEILGNVGMGGLAEDLLG